MKRAIIFDFGGVLMKTADYAPRHRWDDRLGLPRGTVERTVHNDSSWVQAQHGKIPMETYWYAVARQLGLSNNDIEQLAADFYSGDQLDAELMNYIDQLRKDGHQIALLSNDSVELRPKLEKLHIASLFDPLLISAEIGVMKPDSEAYRIALEKAGRLPEEAIFIDDRWPNVAGAQAVGIHGVHYTDGMFLPDVLAGLLQYP